MGTDVISNLRLDLAQQSDEKTKLGYTRFFKEKVLFYGVKSSVVSGIAKKYFPTIKILGKDKIFDLCEDLFRSDYCEEAFIASDWVYRLHNEFGTGDFEVFERWLKRYINNWAKCDTFCNHTLGSFIEKYPNFIGRLKEWTKSENRWLRRAASVTLIIPARKGKFLSDIFEISDKLLTDKDDLVQKGYGWMLKDASIKHCGEVFGYIMKNKHKMPRTALRYAIERMPEELKKQAMEK
jgi:3-methyladenine DNA glycosylase AlkD